MDTNRTDTHAVILGVGEGRFSPGPLFDVGWNSRQPEVDQLKRVIQALKDIIAMTDPCIHQQVIEAQQAHAEGRTMTLDEYMASRGLGPDKAS